MKQVDLNAQLVGRSTGRLPSTPGDDPKAQARAWRLEMERAQMQEWLSHGAIGIKPSVLLPSAAMAPQIASASASRAQPDNTDASATAQQAPLPAERASGDGPESTGATPPQAKGEDSHDQPAGSETVLREGAPPANAGNETAHWSLSEVAHFRPQTADAPLPQRAGVTAPNGPTRPSQSASRSVGETTQGQALGTLPMAQAHTGELQAGQRSSTPGATVRRAHGVSTVVGAGSQVGKSPSVSGNAQKAAVRSLGARPVLDSTHGQLARLAESLKSLGNFDVTSATVQIRGNASVGVLGSQPANAATTPHEISVARVEPLQIGTAGRSPGLLPASKSDASLVSGTTQSAQVNGTQHTDDDGPPSSRPNSRQAGQQASPSPIRLHADWSEDGVRLWLGMDASCATDLPSITAHLQRWMSAQDVRLLSVVCNGRLVTDMAPQVDEDLLDTGAQVSVGQRGTPTALTTISPISEELK